MRVAIARPAASSPAVLIRLPVDSCAIAFDIAPSVRFKADCENSAFTFVFMTAMLVSP
jgi:hypothetical protein